MNLWRRINPKIPVLKLYNFIDFILVLCLYNWICNASWMLRLLRFFGLQTKVYVHCGLTNEKQKGLSIISNIGTHLWCHLSGKVSIRERREVRRNLTSVSTQFLSSVPIFILDKRRLIPSNFLIRCSPFV